MKSMTIEEFLKYVNAKRIMRAESFVSVNIL